MAAMVETPDALGLGGIDVVYTTQGSRSNLDPKSMISQVRASCGRPLPPLRLEAGSPSTAHWT